MEKRRIVSFEKRSSRSANQHKQPQQDSPDVDVLQVHGFMLLGHEISEFMRSGEIYTMPDIEDDRIERVQYVIPKVRQEGLYEEISELRKSHSPTTYFHVRRDNYRHLQEIVGFGKGEHNDMYVARATVGRGRRVTQVEYGYFDIPENFPIFSIGVGPIPIDSARRKSPVVNYRRGPSLLV